MKYFLFRTPVFLVLIFALPLVFGCGGGGGSGGGNTSGTFEAVVIPIKITSPGTSDQDGLFVSVKGSGVEGGWVEDTKAARIPGSDLVLEPVTGRYQYVLKGYPGSFLPGQYTLKYFLNGTVQEYKSGTIEWTTHPQFTSGISYTYDPNSRYLTISAPALPGTVKYQVELYTAETGSLRRQSNEFISGGAITEYIFESGSFQIVLVANMYESGVLKSKAIYNFRDLMETSVRTR